MTRELVGAESCLQGERDPVIADPCEGETRRDPHDASQRAQEHGLTIFERKTEVCLEPPLEQCWREGCGYGAGGISPRLADALEENGITLPEEIIEGRTREIIVHGDWKDLELPVPPGRQMLTVFRGSRPRQRPRRFDNLDTVLLHEAGRAGARVVTAEVCDLRRTASGRPVVGYRTGPGRVPDEVEADFVVLAAGINRKPGMDLVPDPLFAAVGRVIPGYRPPKVRRAVIACVQTDEELLHTMAGEVHFAQYGSKELSIETSSLIPKGDWMTLVLLGKTVDRARPAQYLQIARDYMALPHIARLLPARARLQVVCACAPNMVVGPAHQPFADRIAVVGDMAVSRLYKDGLRSAYTTSSALASCVLTEGVDRASLSRAYRPVVEEIRRDSHWGRMAFLLARVVFSRPLLSRIVYQALATERKRRPPDRRRLTAALWDMASGDSSYRDILWSLAHPASVRSVLVGGVLVTVRNAATERLFGLRWTQLGRHPTAVATEEVASKRRNVLAAMDAPETEHRPQEERIYSIRIRADVSSIWRQLAKYGDPDREYFVQRFIRVRRTSGEAQAIGSVIDYHVTPSVLSFTLVLENVAPESFVQYRVANGFARGGVLAFSIEPVLPGVNLLTIYLGFDFPRGHTRLAHAGWAVGRRLFPGFVHDVLWNHALCKMKDVVEQKA